MEPEEECIDDPTCLTLQHSELAETDDFKAADCQRTCDNDEPSSLETFHDKHHCARSQIFDVITRFFPCEMAPPRDDLIDMLPM